MTADRIKALRELAARPFDPTLDVDVQIKDKDTGAVKETKRVQFVQMAHAIVLRDALRECLDDLIHYRKSLKLAMQGNGITTQGEDVQESVDSGPQEA